MAKKIDRSYQDKIVDILGRMKEERGKSSTEGNYSTLIVIPTGGGKTVIGLKYVKEHAISKGDKVLWLTHRRQLLAQTSESMFKHDFLAFKDLKNFKYQIVGGEKDKNTVKVSEIHSDTDMLFSTVESLVGICSNANNDRYAAFKEWIRGINSNNQRLHIIYDEAHHIGGANVRHFLEMILCPNIEEDCSYKVEKYA